MCVHRPMEMASYLAPRPHPTCHQGQPPHHCDLPPPLKQQVVKKVQGVIFETSDPPPLPRDIKDLRVADPPDKKQPSAFWILPYYYSLGPCWFSSYDGMHTTAGVLEDAFSCLSDNGGTRRGSSVLAYEETFNINRRPYLQSLADYPTLSDNSVKTIEKRLTSMKNSSTGAIKYSGRWMGGWVGGWVTFSDKNLLDTSSFHIFSNNTHIEGYLLPSPALPT